MYQYTPDLSYMYKAIIVLQLEYGATLIVDMRETQFNKLHIAQNRAMRVILQCKGMFVRQRQCTIMYVYLYLKP